MRVATGYLVTKLNDDKMKPWGEYNRGVGLTPHRLAKMLKQFEIAPRKISWTDPMTKATKNAQGYLVEQFKNAFERYLAAKIDIESS
jgi:hypothetical protein